MSIQNTSHHYTTPQHLLIWHQQGPCRAIWIDADVLCPIKESKLKDFVKREGSLKAKKNGSAFVMMVFQLTDSMWEGILEETYLIGRGITVGFCGFFGGMFLFFYFLTSQSARGTKHASAASVTESAVSFLSYSKICFFPFKLCSFNVCLGFFFLLSYCRFWLNCVQFLEYFYRRLYMLEIGTLQLLTWTAYSSATQSTL